MRTEWREGAPMVCARSNFALVAFKDAVYAVGGIAARDQFEGHRPVLSQYACERYTPASNTWNVINIANLPSLAAFSWTKVDDTQMAILGGSNGSIMQDELLFVDFKTQTCKNEPAQYPFYTCLG
jgi:N-acetylneuraminic acid mutarotase